MAQVKEIQQLDLNDPDFSRSGSWGVGAVVPGHQMRRSKLGRRCLAPIDPLAGTIQPLLIERLALNDWNSVEVAIFDIVDSISSDGEVDDRCLEQFWFVFLNVIEGRPRNFEELGIIILREKLRMAMTANYRSMANSEYVPQIERSQRAFERMARLSADLTESLRRQRAAGSESRVVVAVSQTAQSVANTSPPAAAQTAPRKREESDSGVANGWDSTAFESAFPRDRPVDGPALSNPAMDEAAE